MTFKPTPSYIRFLKKKEALDDAEKAVMESHAKHEQATQRMIMDLNHQTAIRNMEAEMQRASFRQEWLTEHAKKWDTKQPQLLPEPEFSLEEITAAQDAMDD